MYIHSCIFPFLAKRKKPYILKYRSHLSHSFNLFYIQWPQNPNCFFGCHLMSNAKAYACCSDMWPALSTPYRLGCLYWDEESASGKRFVRQWTMVFSLVFLEFQELFFIPCIHDIKYQIFAHPNFPIGEQCLKRERETCSLYHAYIILSIKYLHILIFLLVNSFLKERERINVIHSFRCFFCCTISLTVSPWPSCITSQGHGCFICKPGKRT